MLRIDCPWCGPRDEREFVYGGAAHIIRPSPPETVTDQAWADYLYRRDNPMGLALERWVHRHGCGQWFNVARDTVSHDIRATYKMGDPAPDLDGDAA